MTTLREAAQQALEALELAKLNGNAGLYPEEVKEIADAITALEAALAEPVQEPDDPARRCGGPGCDGTCCQPVQEPQGCDHCNHPLYAATKCRVCGRVTEPVQEPVARVRVNSNVPGRINELDLLRPLPRGEHFLYTSPPQRKPLSEDEIFKIENGIPDDVIGDRAWTICFARAVERAHGIGGEE